MALKCTYPSFLPPSLPPSSPPSGKIGMADHLTLTLGGAGYKAYKCTWEESREGGREERRPPFTSPLLLRVYSCFRLTLFLSPIPLPLFFSPQTCPMAWWVKCCPTSFDGRRRIVICWVGWGRSWI